VDDQILALVEALDAHEIRAEERRERERLRRQLHRSRKKEIRANRAQRRKSSQQSPSSDVKSPSTDRGSFDPSLLPIETYEEISLADWDEVVEWFRDQPPKVQHKILTALGHLNAGEPVGAIPFLTKVNGGDLADGLYYIRGGGERHATMYLGIGPGGQRILWVGYYLDLGAHEARRLLSRLEARWRSHLSPTG
jgi:hypothetical protein